MIQEIRSVDKISIVVPVYNMEKYLARCLTSLCNQTYQNVEILCVNDGSTDSSAAILSEYAQKDERIKIFNQANAGVSVARNIGLKNATGKYVMFCDSDDWYEPDMCQKMHASIITFKTDVVVCNTIFEYQQSDGEQKTEQRRVNEKYYNRAKSKVMKINRSTRFQTNVLVPNKIFKRDIICQNHIQFPKGCTHEDDAFWYMYSFYAKRIYVLSCPLYHYLLRQNSIMGKYVAGISKSYWDRIKISDVVCAFLKEKKLLKKHTKDMLLIYRYQLMQILHFFSKEEQQTMIQNVNIKIKKNICTNARLVLSESHRKIVIAARTKYIKMICQAYAIKLIHFIMPDYKKQKLEKLTQYIRKIREI